MVTGPDGCGDSEAWGRAAETRFNDATGLTQTLSPYTSSTDDVLEVVQSLRQDAATQRSSDPPDMGRELNDALANFYVIDGQLV